MVEPMWSNHEHIWVLDGVFYESDLEKQIFNVIQAFKGTIRVAKVYAEKAFDEHPSNPIDRSYSLCRVCGKHCQNQTCGSRARI